MAAWRQGLLRNRRGARNNQALGASASLAAHVTALATGDRRIRDVDGSTFSLPVHGTAGASSPALLEAPEITFAAGPQAPAVRRSCSTITLDESNRLSARR